ncbi:MAG: glucose-1-phosphate adenylyltransferase subunit GlgD [Clostridia bacterium]|nr:glucose-1-phosphate adenylyltransferase subunit GlgD [Clostridia bacterium]
MSAAGLIFSNIHDNAIRELTQNRTMASVPFGCRYRLIDFALSNMVNSNITKVGLITHNNYQSLFDHIGNGKDWDLARRSGGIKILPPFISSFSSPIPDKLYTTRLEALMGVMSFLKNCKEDDIVMSDCDAICNVNLTDALLQHKETGADVTMVTADYTFGKFAFHANVICVESDGDNRLTGLSKARPTEGTRQVSTNIIIVRRAYLIALVENAASRGHKDFYLDEILPRIGMDKFFVYHHKKYYAVIGSLEGYYTCNMELLDPKTNKELFGVEGFPIYTKVRNSAPTKYTENARVKNSYVADGCVVDGVVENSIIFRGVKVGRGSVIRNSIVLQDTVIGEDVTMNCVITDKNVIINNGRSLSGHETLPFFIAKGTRV